MSAFTTICLYQGDAEPMRYQKGEVIFEMGDPGDVMYAILQGEVGLWIDQKLVETITAGDIFGEGALVQVKHSRGSQAIALKDCQLICLSQNRFFFVCQNTPMFAIEVMRSFSNRLRHLRENLSRLDSCFRLDFQNQI